MLTVETIRKIKLAHGREERSIRRIARDFHLSRNTVRKVIRSEAATFEYRRAVQPMPRMAGFTDWVVEQLEHDASQPKKYRRTAKVLYEQLQGNRSQGAGYPIVPIQAKSGVWVRNRFFMASAMMGNVLFPWRRHVCLRERIRSTQRLPLSLAVPKLTLRHGLLTAVSLSSVKSVFSF